MLHLVWNWSSSVEGGVAILWSKPLVHQIVLEVEASEDLPCLGWGGAAAEEEQEQDHAAARDQARL